MINYPLDEKEDDDTIPIPDQEVLGYIELPDFEIRMPTDEIQAALKQIYILASDKQEGEEPITEVAVSKYEILMALVNDNLVKSPDSDNGWESKHYNALRRNFLEPLETFKYITSAKHKVTITDNGLLLAKILAKK